MSCSGCLLVSVQLKRLEMEELEKALEELGMQVSNTEY